MFNVHFSCITISDHYGPSGVSLTSGKHQSACIIKIAKLNFSAFFFSNWIHSFRKYPAYLTVTVGGYQPETTGSVSLTRPMSVLEEETTGDIYTCASDGDDQIDEESHQLTAHSVAENPVENRQQSLNRPEATKILKIKPRLPGQVLNWFHSHVKITSNQNQENRSIHFHFNVAMQMSKSNRLQAQFHESWSWHWRQSLTIWIDDRQIQFEWNSTRIPQYRTNTNQSWDCRSKCESAASDAQFDGTPGHRLWFRLAGWQRTRLGFNGSHGNRLVFNTEQLQNEGMRNPQIYVHGSHWFDLIALKCFPR